MKYIIHDHEIDQKNYRRGSRNSRSYARVSPLANTTVDHKLQASPRNGKGGG